MADGGPRHDDRHPAAASGASQGKTWMDAARSSRRPLAISATPMELRKVGEA